MDVFEAIRTLLAVRSYEDRSVPDDVIQRILEAGRLTASGMNSQPWHFVVVQDREALRQLGSLVRTGPYIAQAPLAIVVAVDRTRLAVSDASRAIQSMLLTAWAEGVGSNWSGFGSLKEVGEFLGIPADLDVLAVLPLGYPVDAIGRGRKNRKPLDQIAHRERWGQPFA
ncbi:MAG: nitroreductase family protein [Thermomicrobiales bacterium]